MLDIEVYDFTSLQGNDYNVHLTALSYIDTEESMTACLCCGSSV